jgi:hypothetical protein
VRCAVVLVVACANPPPASAPPSNRATTERPELTSTTLQIYVQDVRQQCVSKGARDHVEVTIDGRRVGTIIVFCFRASAQARQFRLARDPVVVEGWHRIGVKHLESGRATAKELAFPAGRPADPHEPWIERDKLRVTFDIAALSLGELSIF